MPKTTIVFQYCLVEALLLPCISQWGFAWALQWVQDSRLWTHRIYASCFTGPWSPKLCSLSSPLREFSEEADYVAISTSQLCCASSFPLYIACYNWSHLLLSLWEKSHCPWTCISRFNCVLFSTSWCQDWRWTVLYSTDLICPRSGLAFYLLFSFWLFISCIKDVWGLGDCSNGKTVLVPLQDIPSCWAPMGLTIHLLDAFHQGCLNSTMNASSWMSTMRQAGTTTTFISPMNVYMTEAWR